MKMSGHSGGQFSGVESHQPAMTQATQGRAKTCVRMIDVSGLLRAPYDDLVSALWRGVVGLDLDSDDLHGQVCRCGERWSASQAFVRVADCSGLCAQLALGLKSFAEGRG